MTEKIGLEAIHREGLERLWDAPFVSATDLVGMTCGHKLDWEKVLLQLRDLRLVACASIGMILPPQCRWWLTFRGVQVTQTLKGLTPAETATDPVPWQVSRMGLAAILDRMPALEMFYDTLPAFLEAGRYSHLASGFGSYGRPRLIGIDLLRSDGVHAIATFEGDIKIGLVWAGSRWGPAQARSKQVNRHLTLTVEGASETAPMSAVAVPPDIRSGVSVWVVVGWDTWAAQAAWKTFSGSFPSPPVELFTATGGRINAPAELLPCYRTIRDGDPFAQVGDVDGFATRLEHDLAQHALHEQPGFRVLVTVEEWPDMRADEIAVMADEDIDRVEQTLKRLKEVSLVTEFEQRWSIADQGLVRRARQDRVWVVDARKSTRFPKPGLGQRRRLNRLSLVNELAVRFKSESVPVVAGWRAKLMLCDVLVPFQGVGPFGTTWTELLFERTKTNRDQIFEMLATFRLSANLSRSTILLVVCLDGKSEELFWETGKGLQIFTTTVAEAMTGPLVGRETIWRAFGKPVPCQPVSQAKGHAGHRYSSR